MLWPLDFSLPQTTREQDAESFTHKQRGAKFQDVLLYLAFEGRQIIFLGSQFLRLRLDYEAQAENKNRDKEGNKRKNLGRKEERQR